MSTNNSSIGPLYVVREKTLAITSYIVDHVFIIDYPFQIHCGIERDEIAAVLVPFLIPQNK